jgi:hypothetical protein
LININAVRNITAVYTKATYFNRAALNQLLANAQDAKLKLDKQRATTNEKAPGR